MLALLIIGGAIAYLAVGLATSPLAYRIAWHLNANAKVWTPSISSYVVSAKARHHESQVWARVHILFWPIMSAAALAATLAMKLWHGARWIVGRLDFEKTRAVVEGRASRGRLGAVKVEETS